VSLAGLRTAAIVAGLAAVVAFVPQGGSTAGFIGAILTIAVTVLFVLFGGRLYQMFRTDIYGLGDRHRGLLYGAIGAFVLAMAWRVELLDTTLGSLLWAALIGFALGALWTVFVRWRAYRL
jgi:hypothetical protein